jgi:hypothetical protein
MGTEAIPKTEEKLTKLNCVIAGVVKPTDTEVVQENGTRLAGGRANTHIGPESMRNGSIGEAGESST